MLIFLTFLTECTIIFLSAVVLLQLAADSELSQLKRPILPPEGGVEAWSEHSGEEDHEKEPSLEEKEKPGQKVVSENSSQLKIQGYYHWNMFSAFFPDAEK